MIVEPWICIKIIGHWLDDDSLAKQVFNVQNKLALPGLVEECQEYLVKFGISDITKYSKPQWKRLILEKIDSLNKATLLDTMKYNYKKLDHKNLQKKILSCNLT